VLLIWNKINHDYLKIIPASVVVVLIGIALIMIIEHYFYDGDMNEKYFVTLPEIANWSDLQSIFTLPDFNVLKHINTYEVALTLFVVAALESLLSVAAIDKIDPKFRKTDPDSELIAQGIGNFFAGLIGAIPITAVIVRGSVNVSAGAKSKFSAILHGVLLLLSLLFLSQIINLIPLSALAAILCFTGFKLIDPSEIKRLFRQDKRAFFIFLFTVAGILITDFLIGVISGSILAYILHYQNNKHKSEILFTNLGKEKHIHLKGNIGLPDKNKISYLTKEIDEKSLYIIVIEKNCELDIDSFQIIEEWLKKLDQKQVQYSIIQYGKNYFLK
jgi:carbonic anhydrase